MSQYSLPRADTRIQQKVEKEYKAQNPSSQDLPPFNLVPHPKKGMVEVKKNNCENIRFRCLMKHYGHYALSLLFQAFFVCSTTAAGCYYYGVRILTGSQEAAGGVSNASIKITLVGSRATSDGDWLGSWAVFPKDSMHYDDFVLECSEGLGEVLVVRLENKFPVKEEWFVDFVEVHDFHTSAKKVFPCYHWIRNNDSISFSSSTSKHHVIAIDIHPAYTTCHYNFFTYCILISRLAESG